MNFVKVKCVFCGKIYLKSLGRINESKKFGWNFFCSPNCLSSYKTTSITSVCGNPVCSKKTSRKQKEFKKSKSGKIFCSTRCSAVYNNEFRKKYKICSVCGKNFYGGNIYCSKKCFLKIANQDRKIPIDIYKKNIISRIVSFYNKNNRIPVKKEMYGLYVASRKLFGTWNKAIIAAGFKPNPVMFAKKYIANDGHKCDSFSEKIIDDWFSAKKIKHERGVPYPENKKLTADFEINNKFIEFFGLRGELKKYDRNIELKEKLAKKYKIKLIKIYPKDLFPHNRLSEIIKI